MKKLLISLVVLAVPLLSSARDPEQLAQRELFDNALSQAGLSTADLAFDLDDRASTAATDTACRSSTP